MLEQVDAIALETDVDLHGGLNIQVEVLAALLDAADDVPRQPLRQELLCDGHVEDEGDMLLTRAIIEGDGGGHVSLLFHATEFDVLHGDLISSQIGDPFLDLERQVVRICFCEVGEDLWQVLSGLRPERAPIGVDLKALESVEVMLEFNRLHVQLLREAVEGSQVRAADDPCGVARKSLTSVGLNEGDDRPQRVPGPKPCVPQPRNRLQGASRLHPGKLPGSRVATAQDARSSLSGSDG